VLEVYGLSETCGMVSTNRTTSAKFGSVGLVCPSTKVKISKEGEILVKSSTVFLGYYKQLTNVFDDDDWLSTGDLGRIDEHGFLWITGRKKNIVITCMFWLN
jgi:long-chain acyl-CoA synthetase